MGPTRNLKLDANPKANFEAVLLTMYLGRGTRS